MERLEAKKLIEKLIGQDLRLLADQLGVTVRAKNGNINKGWVGHVIETYLGLAANSSQSPDFGSWELKVCSLKYLKNGLLTVKETMAITMIEPENIKNNPFENSHLLNKMSRILIPARIWFSQDEKQSILDSVTEFDLDDPVIYNQIKADYELVREIIINQGFSSLSGTIGKYVQPRTKGKGHGSTSRAFYVRKDLLNKMINKRVSHGN
ncbi:MAG: hypothetical protein EA365_02060 [Gloeocapsa sp. DLM2.Bin57]|nr:MAG: hypothetical protein EA365_02060 [Gloeocapsa sp. DLM2.Bin57]